MKLSYLLIIILVIFVISIVSIISNITYFNRDIEDDKDNIEDNKNKYMYIDDPENIYGYWTDSYTYLYIFNNNQVSYQLLDGSLDSGRYLSSNNIIVLERQGQLSIKYNLSNDSITLVNTFVRNTTITPCIDTSSNNYSSCIETAVDNDTICEGGCDVGGGSCITRCNLSEMSSRLSCQNELRSSCSNCNGVIVDAPPSLFGDYECGPYTGKGTSLIGNWISTINDRELISINSDNTVQYQMYDGTQDNGNYNTSNLVLVKQGIKSYQYDISSDTLTVLSTFSRTYPVYGNWVNNDNGNTTLIINTNNSTVFSSTIGNRNTTGKYDPSTRNICFDDYDCQGNTPSQWLNNFTLTGINQATMSDNNGNSSVFVRT